MAQKLVKNIEINSSKNIEVVTAAVGQKPDLVGFHCPSMNNSGNFQVSLR